MLKPFAATLFAITTLAGCQSAGSHETANSSAPHYGFTDAEVNNAIRRGEGKPALAFYAEEAERLLASHEINRGLNALNRGMWMAYRIGELDRGLQLAARAQNVVATSPPQVIAATSRLTTLSVVGTINRRAGRMDEAGRVYTRGLADAKTNYWRGVFSRLLGRLALDAGDRTAAIGHLRRAVDLLEDEISRERREEIKTARQAPRMPHSLNTSYRRELAVALRQLTSVVSPEEALPLARRSLEVSRWLGYVDEQIWALNTLAALELNHRQYGPAEKLLREALAIATRARHEDSLISLHANLARSSREQGRLDEALSEFEHSLRLVEGVRGRLQASEARSDYVENKQALYRAAVMTAIEGGRLREAFALAERARARAFLDLLGTQTSLTRARQSELAAAEARVLGELQHAGAISDESDDDAVSTALRDVNVGEFDRFVARVRADDQEHASLLTVATITADELQVLLPPDTALVEFMVMPTQTVAWIIHKGSIEVAMLPISRTDLADQIQVLREAITDRAALEVVAAQAQALHTLIFQDVRERLRVKRVIVAAHDVLHYLPFAALRSREDKWLVEDYTLTTVPSASVLRYLSAKGTGAAFKALVIGNPELGPGLSLPFAEQEARMVAAHYPDSVLLLRRDASKAKVKALAGGAGVLHFATHAVLRANDPMSSALALSSDGGDPGTLDVREVFKLDLKARLVVLSACETGLGKLSQGDELVGLQRAFLYAGTPAVVSTLWKVEDRATFELMTAFYRELATRGAADALRAAQLNALSHDPHPFGWAAFGLAGMSK